MSYLGVYAAKLPLNDKDKCKPSRCVENLRPAETFRLWQTFATVYLFSRYKLFLCLHSYSITKNCNFQMIYLRNIKMFKFEHFGICGAHTGPTECIFFSARYFLMEIVHAHKIQLCLCVQLIIIIHAC